MSNVIRLDDHRPYSTGNVVCVNCHYEWEAAVWVGTFKEFECPKCHLMKGVFTHLFTVPEGKQLWQCNCGCRYFIVTNTEHNQSASDYVQCGIQFICAQCGVVQQL